MPQLGDTINARQLGYAVKTRYTWVACNTCGKPRWIHLRLNGSNDHTDCKACGRIAFGKRQRGANHHNWQGGRVRNEDGYMLVRIDETSPFWAMAGKRSRWGGYVLEHRLVMARHLDRCLVRQEVVHHKNGIRDDNRLENLELKGMGQHHKDHSKGYRDGYKQGLRDGKDKQIAGLRRRIYQLETAHLL